VVLGIAAYLALTTVFVLVGFPYERLAPRMAAVLGPALGAQVTIGGFGPGLAWGMPQALAWDVEATWPGGQHLRLDRMRLRPAWSTSWLRGDPAFVVALRSPDGEVDGTVRIGDAQGFRGTLSRVVLERLSAIWPGAELACMGHLDADVDLRRSAEGLEGSLALRAADGSIGLPNLPVGIPFSTLAGDLTFGGESFATLSALSIDGPLVAVKGSGTLGRAAALSMAPLALEARIEVRDPAMRGLLSSSVPVGADGVAEIHVGGTLAQPIVQPVGRGRAGPRARTGA
jgi:type II secretion system protein N